MSIASHMRGAPCRKRLFQPSAGNTARPTLSTCTLPSYYNNHECGAGCPTTLDLLAPSEGAGLPTLGLSLGTIGFRARKGKAAVPPTIPRCCGPCLDQQHGGDRFTTRTRLLSQNDVRSGQVRPSLDHDLRVFNSAPRKPELVGAGSMLLYGAILDVWVSRSLIFWPSEACMCQATVKGGPYS